MPLKRVIPVIGEGSLQWELAFSRLSVSGNDRKSGRGLVEKKREVASAFSGDSPHWPRAWNRTMGARKLHEKCQYIYLETKARDKNGENHELICVLRMNNDKRGGELTFWAWASTDRWFLTVFRKASALQSVGSRYCINRSSSVEWLWCSSRRVSRTHSKCVPSTNRSDNTRSCKNTNKHHWYQRWIILSTG